jgi:hypothetical protein
MKGLIALALLAVATVSAALLVSGSAYLSTVLPGGLPAGNAFAALGLVSTAAVPVVLSKSGSVLRRAGLITLGTAGAWLPLSIALAGNLSLNFTGWRGSAWLAFSVVVLLAVLGTLAWAFIGCLFTLWRPAKEA